MKRERKSLDFNRLITRSFQPRAQPFDQAVINAPHPASTQVPTKPRVPPTLSPHRPLSSPPFPGRFFLSSSKSRPQLILQWLLQGRGAEHQCYRSQVPPASTTAGTGWRHRRRPPEAARVTALCCKAPPQMNPGTAGWPPLRDGGASMRRPLLQQEAALLWGAGQRCCCRLLCRDGPWTRS